MRNSFVKICLALGLLVIRVPCAADPVIDAAITAKNPLFFAYVPPGATLEKLFAALDKNRDQAIVTGELPKHSSVLKAAKRFGIDVLYLGDPTRVTPRHYKSILHGNFSQIAHATAGAVFGTIFEQADIAKLDEFIDDRASQFPKTNLLPGSLSSMQQIPKGLPLLSLSFHAVPHARLPEVEFELRNFLLQLDPAKVRLIVDITHPESEELLRRCLEFRHFDTVAIDLAPVRPIEPGFTRTLNGGSLPTSRSGFYQRLKNYLASSKRNLGHVEITAENLTGISHELTRHCYEHCFHSIFVPSAPLVRQVEAEYLKPILKTVEILAPSDVVRSRVVVFDGDRSGSYAQMNRLHKRVADAFAHLPDKSRILVQSSKEGFGHEIPLLHAMASDRFAQKKITVGYFLAPGHLIPANQPGIFAVPSSASDTQDILDFAAKTGLQVFSFKEHSLENAPCEPRVAALGENHKETND
jgi:hypothetical protein